MRAALRAGGGRPATIAALVLCVLIAAEEVRANDHGEDDLPPNPGAVKKEKLKRRVSDVHGQFGPDFEEAMKGVPHCYNQYIHHWMKRANWACCEWTGHFMVGMYYLGGLDKSKSHETGEVAVGRDGGLHRLDHIKCCRPTFVLGTTVMAASAVTEELMLLEEDESTWSTYRPKQQIMWSLDLTKPPSTLPDRGEMPFEAIGHVPIDQRAPQNKASLSGETMKAMFKNRAFLSFLQTESRVEKKNAAATGRKMVEILPPVPTNLRHIPASHNGKPDERPPDAPPDVVDDGDEDDDESNDRHHDAKRVHNHHHHKDHKDQARDDHPEKSSHLATNAVAKSDTNSGTHAHARTHAYEHADEGTGTGTGKSKPQESYWCDCYSDWLGAVWTSASALLAHETCNRRGHFMIGFFRGGHEGCDYSYCIHGFRCCRPCLQLGNTLGLLEVDEAVEAPPSTEADGEVAAEVAPRHKVGDVDDGQGAVSFLQESTGRVRPDDRMGTSFRAKQCECKTHVFGRLQRFQECPPGLYMTGIGKQAGKEIWRLDKFYCCDPCLHLGSDIF